MKKKNRGVSIFIFIAVLIFTESCKKKIVEENIQDSFIEKKGVILDNSPKNINGILTFRDEEHLQSYYNTLDELVNSADDKGLSSDSVLKEIEESLGFLSFRQDFIDKYDWDNKEFTSEEIGEMYKKDFIIDDIRKSILNEYLEVAIGDYIYIYYSENQVYKIPKSKQYLVKKLRNIGKGNDNLIPTVIFESGVELISATAILSTESEIGELKDGYYREFKKTGYVSNVNCEIFDKFFHLSLESRYFDTIDSSLTEYQPYPVDEIIIDFGDGTTETYYTSEVWGQHTYSSVGSYHILITFKYHGDNNNLIINHIAQTTLVNGACTRENASESNNVEFNQPSGNNWRMYYSTWLRKDLFGRHLGAYTHSWLWNSHRSKWKRAKTSLYCRIEGAFRNDDCIVGENLAKSKTKYGKKLSSKKQRIKKWWQIDNGDVNSEHQIHNVGIYYRQQSLNPCD